MTDEQIDNLTEQEAKNHIKVLYANKVMVKAYLASAAVLDDLSEQFMTITIDVEADKDEKSIDRFWVFQKNILSAVETNTKLRALFDDDIYRQEKTKRVGAKRGTLEERIATKRANAIASKKNKNENKQPDQGELGTEHPEEPQTD